MIYVDSNVVYNILFRTDLTPRAQQALRVASRGDMVSSTIVVNELILVVSFKIVRNRVGIGSKHEFLEVRSGE